MLREFDFGHICISLLLFDFIILPNPDPGLGKKHYWISNCYLYLYSFILALLRATNLIKTSVKRKKREKTKKRKKQERKEKGTIGKR